ncbi:hypothetical protein [Geothrix sp. 21YS21S-2]|uniref:hypothetical protein n=1 Tax=Geothrix sp. 21YS21S-2 TaxID=3068893 RepID=UPI0027BB1C78|nr:hypothetical protein [Geothrix sp. 21YS21S-2]
MQTLAELETHDMRKSAIHESGHALVARHYGIPAEPLIFRNAEVSDPLEFKTWLGTTRLNDTNISPLRKRRVGLAGVAAEFLAGTHTGELDLMSFIQDSYGDSVETSDGWSRTDWESAEGWTETDLHAVFMILTRRWEWLLLEVNSLIAYPDSDG